MGFLSRNQSSVFITPTCSFEQVLWSVIKPRRVFPFSRFISRFFLLLGDPDDGDLHVKVLKWDQKFSRSSHLTPSYKNALNDVNLKDLMIQAKWKINLNVVQNHSQEMLALTKFILHATLVLSEDDFLKRGKLRSFRASYTAHSKI